MTLRPAYMSRRGFLDSSLRGLVAAGLPLWYAQRVLADDDEKPKPDNDPVALGVIGVGARGTELALDLAGRTKEANVLAVCDVYKERCGKAAEEVNKKTGKEVAKYEDFRELLKNKDIRAVVIATPDHWHGLCAIEAMKAGKDVYCEKPLAYSIDECQAMLKVALAKKSVFQTGSQFRSDARFRLACELIRNKRLGKLKVIEIHLPGTPKGGPFKVEDVPEGLNWELWSGPAPKADFVKERLNFRWWSEYAGGSVTDLGSQYFDVLHWALDADESGLSEAEGKAATPSKNGQSYNTYADYDLNLSYTGPRVLCTDKGETGIYFEGEGGKWIFVNDQRITARSKEILEDALPEDASKLEVSNDHLGNFLACIKSRKKPITGIEVGLSAAVACHLCNIALQTGKKAKWKNPEVSPAAAAKLTGRDMRAPWKLED